MGWEWILSLFLAEHHPSHHCLPLDSQDSGSLCFCFRWLLIWFKREFPFPDVLRLWEVGLPVRVGGQRGERSQSAVLG